MSQWLAIPTSLLMSIPPPPLHQQLKLYRRLQLITSISHLAHLKPTMLSSPSFKHLSAHKRSSSASSFKCLLSHKRSLSAPHYPRASSTKMTNETSPADLPFKLVGPGPPQSAKQPSTASYSIMPKHSSAAPSRNSSSMSVACAVTSLQQIPSKRAAAFQDHGEATLRELLSMSLEELQS